jgi:hypothetical protein
VRASTWPIKTMLTCGLTSLSVRSMHRHSDTVNICTEAKKVEEAKKDAVEAEIQAVADAEALEDLYGGDGG